MQWSQNRNYWKDSRDDVPENEGETDHAHCNGCYKIKCQYKSKKSCSPMHCPLSCGAVFHSCKANEHKELCGKEIVPCVNAFYGCKQSMRRSERGQHLATCPASVVYCTMEWNRWPVFSRERQERVPFAQKNLHARYGQLDVALAMRDQRILYEAMKAPRRVRRSLRNRLTERFPAVPLTSSHSSYVEGGGSMDATGVTSDEDGGSGDAPWDLSRDPPGLQRSICKELFKTDSGSLHLDALDAQVRERNGSENADKSAFESGRTTSCSGFDQKDMVSASVKHLEGCDMVGLPVGEGHVCSSNGVPSLAGGDINTFNAGEFALVNRPTHLSKLGDEASEERGTVDECLEKKTTEGSTCGTEFHSVHTVFVSSMADKTVKTADENERVSDVEMDVKLAGALSDKISSDFGSASSCVQTGAPEKAYSNFDQVESISLVGDILEGSVSSAGITSDSGHIKQLETERIKTFSDIENSCEKLERPEQVPPDMLRVADQAVASGSSLENVISSEQLSKFFLALTTSNVDLTRSNGSHLLGSSFTNSVDCKTNDDGASVVHESVLLNSSLTDKTPSLDESRSLSVLENNSGSAVAAASEVLVNADRSTNAGKGGSELPNGESNDCQATMTDSSESLEFLPDLVFLGIDVACVSSLNHHNAVVFLPPTGGTIANPGTVVVDLPKEYHGSSVVPPPTIPPPLTLQQILALDLNLESITRYQAKPRSMYTFLCAQNFRRDEYPWHFKNVHSDIHGGLSGWIEARCPLACYGCTYSTRRLNPANGTVLYNSEVDCFGLRPNSSHHAASLGEFCERPSRAQAQKEATPEIYTSKDYDSAVNIKRRSYAKDDELLQRESSSQMEFTGERDVTAQIKDTIADNHKRNNDRAVSPSSDDPCKFETESKKGAIAENTADVFPSCSGLSRDTRASVSRDSYSSTKDIRGASLDRDSMTSSSDIQCLDESLLLRMLPFEVIQHIARCLDSFSLCNLAMTSHFLREVCRSIVEHRGIVIQEWEKKQFDSGSSWQVTYQRWLFSSAFTPCTEWRFEESPSVSEHLKVCPFNVMAEPRSQPFQLCCLSISEDVYRNLEAERILQKMYPEFNPQSIQCEDSSSRMPGAEVLDHLYVNEIGKSGFSGYKRALKSFAQSCSEQFRDTPDEDLEIETSEQFGESLEPRMVIEDLEAFEDFLEPKLETNTSEQFEDYQEPKPETLSSETFTESFVLKLETKTSEPLQDSLESKLETMTDEKSEGSMEAELKTITSEVVEDHLETNLAAKASEQTM